MAIEKTYFTQTTAAANLPEVYEWLAANSTGYFDSVTMSDDSTTITCTIGERAVLTIILNSNNSSYTELKTTSCVGLTYDLREGNNYTTYYALYAKATSNGLMVRYTAGPALFITKTNNGDTFIATVADYQSTSRIIFIDTALMTSTTTTSFVPITASYMGFVPVCTAVGSYTPNLYIAPFTQYTSSLESDIRADEADYVAYGVMCLKDG